jgi:hypothetical protein
MKKARPNYVSPNTEYAGITVTEVSGSPVPSPTPLVVSLTPGSPNCSTSSTGTTCTISATYLVGLDAWTIALYGSGGVTSTPLSINSVSQTVVAGQNTVNLTMNPVVVSLAFSPSSGTCQSNNTTCVQPAVLEALDATNAVIVGPGSYVNASATPVTVVVSPVPAGVTLETSSGSAAATSATGPAQNNLAQIAYNGTGTTGSLQIGASVTAGDPASYTLNLTTPSPAPTSTPVATATLPPQGVYNSCEIDTALTSMCEQEDAAMASDGYKWEINYIGLDANKTGSSSLQAWFTYDASIGLGQAISVKAAINDPVNVLTGKALLSSPYTSSLANSCGATNNEQIISCIYSVASSVPSFNWKWYIYDEPGCPNQSIGYCQGTLAGGNYNNVATLAQYIQSIDPTHPVIGTEVGDMGDQTVVNTEFSWLLSPASPVTGFDHYPIPENGNFGMIDDIGTIAGELANTIAADYSPEQMYYVGQAFSWYQASGTGCISITVCPYPTTAQMQDMRDQALYYANKAGKPMSMIFWYYWPDITCMNTYSGCSATANRASLKSAAFAPFPATPPP